MPTIKKSDDAFRTIAEVSAMLGVEQHALRYWESQFKQVRPVKRKGNRRLYRPSDIRLIAGLKKLLHEDNYTLKGVQKILGQKGVEHVATLGSEYLNDRGLIEGTSDRIEPESPETGGIEDASPEPLPAEDLSAAPIAASEPVDTAVRFEEEVSVEVGPATGVAEADPDVAVAEAETPDEMAEDETPAPPAGTVAPAAVDMEEPAADGAKTDPDAAVAEAETPDEVAEDETPALPAETVAPAAVDMEEPAADGAEAEPDVAVAEAETPDEVAEDETPALPAKTVVPAAVDVEEPTTEVTEPEPADEEPAAEVAEVKPPAMDVEAESTVADAEADVPDRREPGAELEESAPTVNVSARGHEISISPDVINGLSPADLQHIRQLVGRLEELRDRGRNDIRDLRSKFGLATDP